MTAPVVALLCCTAGRAADGCPDISRTWLEVEATVRVTLGSNGSPGRRGASGASLAAMLGALVVAR